MNNLVKFPFHLVKPTAATTASEAGNELKKFPDIRDLTLEDLAARASYEQARQEPTPNADGIHVGDLFVHSWGYEQTNINFYQVIELRGKHTAIIREIEGEKIGGAAWSGDVRPCRGHFCGEPLRAKTRPHPWDEKRPAQVHHPRFKRWMDATTDDAKHAYSTYG